MIADALPRSAPAAAAPSAPTAAWQRELQRAFTDPRALAEYLGLDPCPPFARGSQAFRVPRAFAARMRRGDPDDPLLRQVWPQPREAAIAPGFGRDPVGDLAALRGGGMLHKYRGRALLVLTGACAVHCRYCFRRHFPYAEAQVTRSDWQALLQQLAADPDIDEVILSGGDPLSLTDARLEALVDDLLALPRLRRLRMHSRQPVVLPQRVDAALCGWLSRLPLPMCIVLHINHAAEIDDHVLAACRRLRDTGAVLLNQSVLLAGVNDDADVLAELSQRLFDAGVTPYYLHQLDRVQGAAHFAVADARAIALIAQLRARLPGYLVPRLAREEAGMPSKTLLA